MDLNHDGSVALPGATGLDHCNLKVNVSTTAKKLVPSIRMTPQQPELFNVRIEQAGRTVMSFNRPFSRRDADKMVARFSRPGCDVVVEAVLS